MSASPLLISASATPTSGGDPSVPAQGPPPQQQNNQRDGNRVKKEPERVFPMYSWLNINPFIRLVYTRDTEVADRELADLPPGPLGFDLEWKPIRWKGAKHPVALVQLASQDRILLLQLTAMRRFPQGLTRVLESPAYLKAGVGIQGDCKKLWEDWGVNIRNCVDLALLARSVDNARWKGKYTQPIGLARLCQTYFELDLDKGRTTRSNWELLLTVIQQHYAANDAHSGLMLYQHLNAMRSAVDPIPLPTYYTFDFYEGLLFDNEQPELLWHPHNPNYDPGPPPPPREDKEGKKEDRKDESAEGSSTATPETKSEAVADQAISTTPKTEPVVVPYQRPISPIPRLPSPIAPPPPPPIRTPVEPPFDPDAQKNETSQVDAPEVAVNPASADTPELQPPPQLPEFSLTEVVTYAPPRWNRRGKGGRGGRGRGSGNSMRGAMRGGALPN